MKGLITLYNAVMAAVDQDDDFDGTVYAGPRIISANVGLGEDVRSMKAPEHPNLLRAMVEVNLLRVRIVPSDPHLKDLFAAYVDKLKNKPAIKELFQDAITPVDDPDKPANDGITNRQRWLGVKSNFKIPAPTFSSQQQELLTLQLYIYQQRFPKQMSESLIGE